LFLGGGVTETMAFLHLRVEMGASGCGSIFGGWSWGGPGRGGGLWREFDKRTFFQKKNKKTFACNKDLERKELIDKI